MNFRLPQNPGIGGLDELTTAEELVVQQIAGLGDPNADRILFWDDSAGSFAYLTAGSGLSISGTTISSTGSAINRSVNVISTTQSAGSTALTDYVYICTAAITLTLPTAVGNTNRYTVINAFTADITVDTTSLQTINGSTSITIPADHSVDLISNNSDWRIC